MGVLPRRWHSDAIAEERLFCFRLANDAQGESVWRDTMVSTIISEPSAGINKTLRIAHPLQMREH
jgi:hypothetical protein